MKEMINETRNVPEAREITEQEWFSLSLELENRYTLFYEMMKMGKPSFTRAIPTACVTFDQEGDQMEFLWNPDFWDSLSTYERAFVLAHECLHVCLNHGIRGKDSSNLSKANIAMDIVVNHMLIRTFGFDRGLIRNWNNYCWTDTVFDEFNVPTNESFEYYYARIKDSDVEQCGGSGGSGYQTVDDHSGFLSEEVVERIIDELNQRLTNEEKNDLKKDFERHFQSDEKEDKNKRAGTGVGGWTFVNPVKMKRKKKWETIIMKVSKKWLLDDYDYEQWAIQPRRMSMLSNNLMLPSEIDDDARKESKIDVFFFLDASGSCWHLKDRFFKAAGSLPTERFNVRLFCFDSTVKETSLESKKVYGGGGTSFWVIEEKIQRIIREEGKKYPEAVFIVTDGWGDHVTPQFPKRWYWFLSEKNTRYIPKNSHTFCLEDFE